MHIKASVLRNAIGATLEAKITRAFMSARIGVEFQIMLIEMGHLQPVTLLEIYYAAAFSVLVKQIFLNKI